MWVLARKILLHDRVKFAVAAAGVSISVLLVLVQIGLYFGFMENASTLIDHGKADLWVTARGNENFDFAAPMDERLYYRVAEVPGVARAERMILAFGQFKLPDGGTQGVQVVGIEPTRTCSAPGTSSPAISGASRTSTASSWTAPSSASSRSRSWASGARSRTRAPRSSA
jgi:putative ABC transport system permease protein